MPCEGCGIQFNVFKRRRACPECDRWYCGACLRRAGGLCAPCRTLCTRPLARAAVAQLKARDMQCFLQRQNVSTRGCVEKEELVTLCLSHVNSSAYKRRGARGASAGPLTALRGLTNNINDFISSTFDLRAATAAAATDQPRPAPPPSYRNNVYNRSQPAAANGAGARERFTTRPRGEPDVEVAPPAPAARPPERRASADDVRVDTADCYEIEDLDDSGWEFVRRPADPLPTDSDELMREAGVTQCQRSASDFDLRPSPSPPDSPPPASPPPASPPPASPPPPRTASPAPNSPAPASPAPASPAPASPAPASPAATGHVTLGQMADEADLDGLSVKQLKELLVRNRVEFRGCVERAELLARARLLWQDHTKYRDELERLPLEECCKICMAAPLECVLLECGHIAACTECAVRLAECPICRQYVVRAVRFFRS